MAATALFEVLAAKSRMLWSLAGHTSLSLQLNRHNA
jgi:hypothetical protein